MATPPGFVLNSDSLGWRFAQCFGDKGEVEDITEADFISTVEFNYTGDYLAIGDQGGQVVFFECDELSKKECEYKFYTEFQSCKSHEPEFDYLKSLEIEEKINKTAWCKRQKLVHFLTNETKLWKVFKKSLKFVTEDNHMSKTFQPVASAPAELKLPRLAFHDTIIAAVPCKVYANAHFYHTKSISINLDGKTYMSADDLQINLWNLAISEQSFSHLDIKPENMEEFTEVIKAAKFYHQSCNLFCYWSLKSAVKLADMQSTALCDTLAK
ncbi:hypothetical protein DFH28DRAFT_1190429, partial [Melampsora americana]